ncbi:hypothetical protein NDU88_001770 [Pleurodeles waltl]|uniref:Uncharacterized protein n=1 Tax=Pleurodeles waltl TaxID=8319 RepID=A0AAV7LCG2_PLEWA|nr:hypothetical protein NDU88_001770 [Pleurodeles waltl]
MRLWELVQEAGRAEPLCAIIWDSRAAEGAPGGQRRSSPERAGEKGALNNKFYKEAVTRRGRKSAEVRGPL